ncbi:MAG: N-acetyl-gamma-glutamyl-phosphate reductase, partial [Candidatus Eremiobacteraeota bacterium]|nr:N-acetyl-gamma-glutamyl-phosphate reductase [Candidatus Eremiobacteraeota bacterium]
SLAGESIGKHFAHLRSLDRIFDAPQSVQKAVVPGDVVFLAGAHGTSRAIAPALLAAGARIIDLSADFRFAENSNGAVYGFPELYRSAIQGASFIANPGCYPTASLLALAPLALLSESPAQIIIDAKSGITGAGRIPTVGSLFAEVDGDVRAYGLDGHRHLMEIEQELRAIGLEAGVLFTPHVVPIRRGMLVDAYCVYPAPLEEAALAAAFLRFYDGNSFVRLLASQTAPSLLAVSGTNKAEIHFSTQGVVVRILCAIDNLGKGAAGQAVQNFNIMHYLPEECGLNDRAFVA